MVKKILVLCFDVYDRPLPEDHISNTKLEKGDHYYIQTMSRNNVPKSARKYKRNMPMLPGHPITLLKSN